MRKLADFSFLTVLGLSILLHISVTSSQSIESLQKSGVPDDVVKIIEGISKIQKNVTVNPNNKVNIRVATGSWKKKDKISTKSKDKIKKPEKIVTKTENIVTKPEKIVTKPEKIVTKLEDLVTKSESTKSENIKSVNVKPEATKSENLNTKSEDTKKPFVITPDVKPNVIKKLSKPSVPTRDEENIEDNLVETGEDNVETSTAVLQPPTESIFTYGGISQWFNWVVSMRDPQSNPNGTSSWRSILAQGVFYLIRQYNPFENIISYVSRSVYGRSVDTVDTDNLANMLAVYNNRDKIIEKLKNNELQPDAESIVNFATELDLLRDASEKLDIVPEDINAADPKTALSNIITILGGQGIQISAADLNLVNNKPVQEATPTEVTFINFLLKLGYGLIPLLLIPFSGIENFFLAPLPPNLDRVPGMLRLFGLQALLGPDYVLDYDAAYDPAYDAPDEAVAAELAAEEGLPPSLNPGEIDDYTDYDYDDTKRRKDVKVFKRYKTKSSYASMGSKMKPPPSRYGVPLPYVKPSSYSNVEVQAKE